MRLISVFFNFVQEIIFDHEDEYNFKSPKFNIKKIFFLALLTFSIIINLFLTSNFIRLGNKYIELQKENVALKSSKNNKLTSSDSQKP